MSPHSQHHASIQGTVIRLLVTRFDRPGECNPEWPVQTPEGVKVPDVIWISAERLSRRGEAFASAVMPEIVVEVVSESNTAAEMEDKRRLYFEGGAVEVWLVSPDGTITFYDEHGAMDASRLAPDFPPRLPEP